jgi:hypothetical protein
MTKPSVSIKILDAIQAQTDLFALIKEFVGKQSHQVLERDAIAHVNFWRTIRYRSILLTFDVHQPENNRKYPFGWFLYYKAPTVLVFAEKNRNLNKWVKLIPPLDLAKETYFELPEDEKRKIISDYVLKSLAYIKSKND